MWLCAPRAGRSWQATRRPICGTRTVTLMGEAHTCVCTSTPKATRHGLGKLRALLSERPETRLLGIRVHPWPVGTGTDVPEGFCAGAVCDCALTPAVRSGTARAQSVKRGGRRGCGRAHKDPGLLQSKRKGPAPALHTGHRQTERHDTKQSHGPHPSTRLTRATPPGVGVNTGVRSLGINRVKTKK